MNNAKRFQIAKQLLDYAIKLEEKIDRPKNTAYAMFDGVFTTADEMFRNNSVVSNNKKSGVILCRIFHIVNNRHLFSLDTILTNKLSSEWLKIFEVPDSYMTFCEVSIDDPKVANHVMWDSEIISKLLNEMEEELVGLHEGTSFEDACCEVDVDQFIAILDYLSHQ